MATRRQLRRATRTDLLRHFARRQVVVTPQVHHTPLAPPQRKHYWHPQRFGVRFPDERFRERLHEIHPDLEIVWSPVHERWLVWARSVTVTHWLCAGWSLKFTWQDPAGGYLPLDNRVFADIYARDFRRFGGAVQYFDRLEAELRREEAVARADTNQETADIRKEFMQYRRIKNIGHGSKFALHHDGTVVESPGERLWRMQREAAR